MLVNGASALLIFTGIAVPLCIAACVSRCASLSCLLLTEQQVFGGCENIVPQSLDGVGRVFLGGYLLFITDRYYIVCFFPGVSHIRNNSGQYLCYFGRPSRVLSGESTTVILRLNHHLGSYILAGRYVA